MERLTLEWYISLWLNNDQGAQEWANEVLRNSPGESVREKGQELANCFVEQFIEEEIENKFTRGMITDILQSADWGMIAEDVYVEE